MYQVKQQPNGSEFHNWDKNLKLFHFHPTLVWDLSNMMLEALMIQSPTSHLHVSHTQLSNNL